MPGTKKPCKARWMTECGKRKPQKTEESPRPGLCLDCYAKKEPTAS